MDVDPEASMRCWAMTVELAGREFEIPALPAADWWPVLSGMDSSAMLDMFVSTPDLDVDALILDGTVGAADLKEVFSDTLTEVTGRPWHAAFVLATVANQHWPAIGGAIARTGFRWDQQPIAAALDLIYVTIFEALDEKNREKFTDLLENESLTQPGKKRAPSQRIKDEFESMAGPRPAPAPVPAQSTVAQSGGERSKTRIRPRQPRQDGQSAAPRKQP